MESPWKTLEAAAKAVVDETAATGDTDIEGIDNRTEYTLITPSNCLKKQDHLIGSSRLTPKVRRYMNGTSRLRSNHPSASTA